MNKLTAVGAKESASAAAPEDEVEIEITPEMVEAGKLALSEYDCRFETDAECVIRVFRAMRLTSRRI